MAEPTREGTTGEVGGSTVSRHRIAQAVAFAVVASAVGIAIGLSIHWFPVQAAKEASKIDTLYDVLIIVSVPIFVMVLTVVLFSVWQFRMKPGEELKDGPPIHGNTRLEIVWTAIPAFILISLCTYAAVVLHDIEAKAPGGSMLVNVTGEQFAWHFAYPGAGGKIVRSDELYLPLGKQVKFDVRTKDVLHDFWVPAFRQKIDAVPGLVTSYRVTPSRIGTYTVVCAELCGLGHSTMRQTVHVMSQNDFNGWLSDQKLKPPSSPE
jgi:cytochrome c oxidase subunit 2